MVYFVVEDVLFRKIFIVLNFLLRNLNLVSFLRLFESFFLVFEDWDFKFDIEEEEIFEEV